MGFFKKQPTPPADGPDIAVYVDLVITGNKSLYGDLPEGNCLSFFFKDGTINISKNAFSKVNIEKPTEWGIAFENKQEIGVWINQFPWTVFVVSPVLFEEETPLTPKEWLEIHHPDIFATEIKKFKSKSS